VEDIVKETTPQKKSRYSSKKLKDIHELRENRERKNDAVSQPWFERTV